jgi:glycine betaine/proline transport system substrate-binding protein
MRLFKLIVALFTSITITNAANAAEVKMAKANWDTGYFQAEIYKQALEKMGYKVTEMRLTFI